MVSPRVLRYSRAMSDQELDAAIAIPPTEIILRGDDIVLQSELLRKALNSFYVPDRQSRKLLRFLLSVATAHAIAHFSTDDDYLRQLCQEHPWGDEVRFAICLTGLGGVGKSQLLAALGRLLSERGVMDVPGYRNLPLVSRWAMSLRDGKGLNALLGPHVQPDAKHANGGIADSDVPESAKKAISIPLIKKLARRRSWRDAVCLMMVDELQSMALGADASAAAATLLLNLLTIGPEVIYCANFSLLHKFMSRPDEDTQRLLSRPRVLHPLGAKDSDWVEYLRHLKAVAPTVLAFDPMKDAEEIHAYTFGIKRLAVLLTVESFSVARSRNRKATVGIEELGLGYLSFGYSANRSVVEDLRNQHILRKEVKKHLWSPFSETGSDSENVQDVREAIDAFESRVDDALLRSALSPLLATAAGVLMSDESKAQGKTKVVTLRPPKATKEQLLQGARFLDE